MDYATIAALRDRHPAWRLLRAGNAVLILSFLGGFFVEGNRGACPASELAAALDDQLHALNAEIPTDGGEPRFPKEPRAYLEDWATTESACLRRFYPPGDDEVHYEVTAAFEKAYSWVMTLQGRAFVGTESRLHTVVELLRQIVHGTEEEPEVRLAELRRRRDEIDAEIAAVESGVVTVLDATAVRDRYQQLSATARELLSDFREVEENFRRLDRAAREKIAAWDGSKGELLADLVGSRSQIAGSDQGRSFQSFYDFLLSEARQAELNDLLAKVSALDTIEADRRIRGIHNDWSEAADRAQRTVRQISEQLRRFLDDQVGWRSTSPASRSRCRSSVRSTRPRRRWRWRARLPPALRKSTPTCCSPRTSSTRPGWSTSCARCCRRTPRPCCPTSLPSTRSSRARRRSSATSPSTTRT